MNETNTHFSLRAFSDDIAQLVAQCAPLAAMAGGDGVVPRSATAIGSGFYVTAALDAVPGETVPLSTDTDTNAPASVIEFWPHEHLALLSTRDDATISEAVAALSADESIPHMGSVVITLAYPSPEGREVRMGVVRCAGSSGDYIQTDDPPFPGFAGAAVVDIAGKLVGVTRLGAGGNSSHILTMRGIRELLRGERTAARRTGPPAGLGIQTHAVEIPRSARQALDPGQESGLFIAEVLPGGGAANAGLLFGDVIVAISGHPVENVHDLHEFLEQHAVGDSVDVRILRGGNVVEMAVSLAELDDAAAEHETRDRQHGRHGRHGGRGDRRSMHGDGWSGWSVRRMTG